MARKWIRQPGVFGAADMVQRQNAARQRRKYEADERVRDQWSSLFREAQEIDWDARLEQSEKSPAREPGSSPDSD